MSRTLLPGVWLELPGSVWPPARDGLPAGVSAVSGWQVERELVGNVLPGNVRARSGLSVGTGSATIPQSRYGLPLSPWSPDRGRRVVTQGPAHLYAAAAYDAVERVELGDWIVDPASGALTSAEVSVALIEAKYKGRLAVNRLPELALADPYSIPAAERGVDPAWMVDVLARQCGYYSTPPRVASAVLSIPGAGGFAAEAGFAFVLSQSGQWGHATGALGPVGPFEVYCWVAATDLLDNGASGYFTFSLDGTLSLVFNKIYPSDTHTVTVSSDGTLTVAIVGGTTDTGSWTPGLDATHPSRVQVEVQRLGWPGAWTGLRARARSADDAAWSAWVTASKSTDLPFSDTVRLIGDAGASLSGLQWTTEPDPDLWVPVNAHLDALGGRVAAPWLPGATDAWTGIQEVCASHLAAAWVTRDKTLLVRNRTHLAGIDTASTPIDVGALVEDIAWTTDPADTADRLEVTYYPPDFDAAWKTSDWDSPIVWQAGDVIEVDAGAAVEVVADLENFANTLTDSPLSWAPAWDNNLTLSTWSAFTDRDASGTHVAASSVQISHRRVSAGRAIITIRNTGPATIYMVDANAAPCVILRGFLVGRQETPAVITRGLPEAEATNPISIDLGRHVQNAADAEAITDYIWARVSQPMWRASGIRVVTDLTRDIGDILELTHTRSGLSARGLVTKVALDGSAGEIAQTLDIVLLPPTWADFDTAWTTAAGDWDDFDTLWAGRTWDDFDDAPLRTS